MGEWWQQLRGRPFYWALDGTNPAVDLFMLRHVVGRHGRSPVLRAARLTLQESPEVVALKQRLARGKEALWVLRLLAELGVSGDDELLAESLDHLLAEDRGHPLILLHIALAFRFHEDERVQGLLRHVREHLASDSLHALPLLARADWLTLSAMALAEQPEASRDAETLRLLKEHLQRLPPEKLSRYQRYTFPSFDQPDELILARSALRLGLAGAWLEPWVAHIVAAQDEQGFWHLACALPTPGNIQWEAEGQPSRWITAQALYILREFYGE